MELAAPVAPATRAWRHAPRTTRRGATEGRRLEAAQVEIVVPVHNEAHQLTERVATLRGFLDTSFPFSALLTIVDNGSTDGTPLVARRLAATMDGVEALTLPRTGRGYALRRAWEASSAEIVAYMDVDLSTSLSGLMPLVASVLSGHGDIAVGTRLARGSRVVRGPKRELISRAYSLLVRTSLRSRVSDFQCGFKALRRDRALELLPLVTDEAWFFDTELLITAERLGMRITELPVEWVDDPDSRVDILSTAAEDLKGLWRISHGPAVRDVRDRQGSAGATIDQATSEQLLSFAGVGLLSTLTYLLLLALGSRPLGVLAANAVALAFCTLGNTALHRSLALSGAGHATSAWRRPLPHFLVTAGALFAVSFTFTTCALLGADALGATSFAAVLVAVTLANAAASLVRFAFLRGWAFRPCPRKPVSQR